MNEPVDYRVYTRDLLVDCHCPSCVVSYNLAITASSRLGCLRYPKLWTILHLYHQ